MIDSFLESLKDEFQFVDWGYTENSIPLSKENYLDWVNRGAHFPLSYLEGERKVKRLDVKNYYQDFQSSLVFLFSYVDTKKYLDDYFKKSKNQFKLASYVLGFYGEDYHQFLKNSLVGIGEKLQSKIENLEFKLTLDTQPILERDLAYRSGLGWFGKNSMLINRFKGSYLIIGSLLFNQKLISGVKENLERDHCGNCTACIEACPTDAIEVGLRTIESSKCISTFTIEMFKDSPPPKGYQNSNGEIFGCDICQEVCPWNNKPLEFSSDDIDINENILKILDFFCERSEKEVIESLNNMSNREYRRFFKGTPLERTGRVGMLKNIHHLLNA